MEQLFEKVSLFKDSRLPSLYSDFSPLKELNPEGYTANVEAWSQLLTTASSTGYLEHEIVVPSKGLPSHMSHKTYGEPKCLGTILNHLVQQKKFVPWSIYKDSSLYSSKRLADYVSPLTWLLVTWAMMKVSKFNAMDRSGALIDETYIPLDRLQAIGDKVWAQLRSQVDRLGTYSGRLYDDAMFAELVISISPSLSTMDIKALELYFSRDLKQMTLVKQNSKSTNCYIKLHDDGSELTKDDIAIIKVKSSMHGLSQRAEQLENKLNSELPSKMKASIQLTDKTARRERLRHLLSQRTSTTKSLQKCNEALANLERVMQSIDEAYGNSTMIDVLLSAKSTLETLNSKVSLDDVENLRNEIDDEMRQTDEITEGLSSLNDDIDDDEIEKELQQLEALTSEHKEVEDKTSGAVDKAPASSSDELVEQLQGLKVSEASPKSTEEDVKQAIPT